MTLTNITVNPKILAGHPVITGIRIPVSLILNLVFRGYSSVQIIREYPELTKKDIKSAILYAEERIKREEVITV